MYVLEEINTRQIKMKIELELKELVLKDAYNKDNYKEAGLHLVNDGIAWLLVNVEDNMVHTMPIPNKDIIKQYEFNAETRCMEDIKGILENKLNYIIDLLERQDDIPLAVQPINTEVDIDKITKLVQSINAPFINTFNKVR